MAVRSCLVGAMAAGLLGLSAASAVAESPAEFTSYGNVHAAQPQADGGNWFETWDEGKRFLLEPKYKAHSDALWQLLRSANAAGLAIKVQYDPSAAHFDAASKKFIYPVCSVELDEARVQTERTCDASKFSPRTAEGQVGLALALSTSAAPRDAIGQIDRALAGSKLDPSLEVLALGTRARAYDSIGGNEVPDSDPADRAMVAALADYRRLAMLAPNDVEVALGIGWSLQVLGSYDEARSAYQDILKRWPDEKFRATLRLAMLERQIGNVEASLDLINGLAGEPGADGMRFHYHRGWSLNSLGRFDEAIADLTAGMRAQPDYASAYERRACAYASVGNLSAALSDLETAVRLLAKIPHLESVPGLRHDLRRNERVAAMLRDAIATSRSTDLAAVCGGAWGNFDEKRKPSPLLPSS